MRTRMPLKRKRRVSSQAQAGDLVQHGKTLQVVSATMVAKVSLLVEASEMEGMATIEFKSPLR
jgi:hypothetical protein